MTEPIPAERLSAAVPKALALVAAIDAAPSDQRAALDHALTIALADGEDTEALVLALANMAHALVVTLARQTGTPVAGLLASMGQVGDALGPQAPTEPGSV